MRLDSCRDEPEEETAGESDPNGPHCIRESGCAHLLTNDCVNGCREAADEVTRLGEEMEPEAPHEHDWTEWGAVYHGGHLQWRECACGATESTPEGHTCPECCIHMEGWEGECPCPLGCLCCKVNPAPQAPMPRRLPYAVAYATGSGALYTLVLPDEMTCAVIDGVLVLSHPSGVLGIQQVKPMEAQ